MKLKYIGIMIIFLQLILLARGNCQTTTWNEDGSVTVTGGERTFRSYIPSNQKYVNIMRHFNLALPFTAARGIHTNKELVGEIDGANFGSGGLVKFSVYTYDASKPNKQGKLIYGVQSTSDGLHAENWNVTTESHWYWFHDRVEKSTDIKKLLTDQEIFNPDPECAGFFGISEKNAWKVVAFDAVATIGGIALAPFTGGASLGVALAVDLGGQFVLSTVPLECHKYFTVKQPVILELYVKNATVKSITVPGSSVNVLPQTPKQIFVQEHASYKKSIVKNVWDSNTLAHPNYALVAAHRGYWANPGVSENTITACVAALELGADMLEVDIRLSSDKVPMLIHDQCIKDNNGNQVNIASLTGSQLSQQPTYDRFGNKTADKINKLEELFDVLGDKVLITLDIKDSDYNTAFKECLKVVKNKNLIGDVIFKGSKTKTEIETLITDADVGITDGFNTVQYTPVIYSSGSNWTNCQSPTNTNCFQSFRDEWGPLITNGKIKAVETYYKLGVDPQLSTHGTVKWLQDNHIHFGMFSFTADTAKGVINTPNPPTGSMECQPTVVREYYHNFDYRGSTPPSSTDYNDGRGDIDWIFQKAKDVKSSTVTTYKPTYFIHDRPDMLIKYLEAAGMRQLTN